MDFQVKLVERETIKPSSPTPSHLSQFALSVIDQLYPPVYTRLIFFYAGNNGSNGEGAFVSKLKVSLSRTLTHFYPLAGRVTDNLYIECDDQGLSFSETRVTGCDLADLLRLPDILAFDRLFPSQGKTFDPAYNGEKFQIYVQANIFPCGGLALGVSLLHKVIDGTLISQFLKKWASFATIADDYRCDETNHAHNHNYNAVGVPASAIFPNIEALPSNASVWAGKWSPGKPKSGGERFVFDAKAISSLRAKATSETVPNPSAIEVLSGFIWKCMMRASRAESGTNKPAVLSHLVNIRQRVDPPLPEDAVGNLVWKAIAPCRGGHESEEPELPGLVSLLRKSFVEMKGEYVGKLTGKEGLAGAKEWLDRVENEFTDGDADAYAFISFCRMGFSELDFGWGKPVWVSPGELHNAPFDRAVFFLDATSGKERELKAWVCFEPEKMAILVQDPEFLAFTAHNPCIDLSS